MIGRASARERTTADPRGAIVTMIVPGVGATVRTREAGIVMTMGTRSVAGVITAAMTIDPANENRALTAPVLRRGKAHGSAGARTSAQIPPSPAAQMSLKRIKWRP